MCTFVKEVRDGTVGPSGGWGEGVAPSPGSEAALPDIEQLWSTDLISMEMASTDKKKTVPLSSLCRPLGANACPTANAVAWKSSEVTTKLGLYLNSDPLRSRVYSHLEHSLLGAGWFRGGIFNKSLSRGQEEKYPPGVHLQAWGTLTLLSC